MRYVKQSPWVLARLYPSLPTERGFVDNGAQGSRKLAYSSFEITAQPTSRVDWRPSIRWRGRGGRSGVVRSESVTSHEGESCE